MSQIGVSYTSIQAHYASISASSSVGPGDDTAASERAPLEAAEASGDSVSISATAFAMRQDSLVIEASLTSIEASVSEADITSVLAGAYDALSAFEEAGRSDYLDSIANPTDLSAEATADRILGGITGYIFQAFQLDNPDATAEEFEGFFAEVTRGFEQGFAEALDVIQAAGALTDDFDADVHRTADLVREGLAQFHDEALAMFQPPGIEALAA